MRVLRQLTINDEQLEKFPFRQELSMQAYLIENEEILNLDENIYCDVQIYDEEVQLKKSGKNGGDGRIDLIASYGSEYIAIIELKKAKLTEGSLKQLEGYLGQKDELLRKTKNSKILENENPDWIGILIGDSICPQLESKISDGYLFNGEIPIAALTIERFKGNGNTYVITDLYFSNKSKSKNNDKYEFFDETYGKGRLVLAVIKRYVKDSEKVTLSDINDKFIPNLKNHADVVTTALNARKIYANKGRKRHFIKPDELIKLYDGTEIAVNSQWGNNIGESIKRAKKQQYNIATVKQTPKSP